MKGDKGVPLSKSIRNRIAEALKSKSKFKKLGKLW